jgi:glycosidase
MTTLDSSPFGDLLIMPGRLYLTLRGTPIMYCGEEIGIQNNDAKRREDVKDPIGRRGWPKGKGRDGERTPMQWSGDPQAGITTGTPWNAIPATYHTYNVADEVKDPNSILNWYKGLLALRHTNAALQDGDYIALNERDPSMLSYLWKSPQRRGECRDQHVGLAAKDKLRFVAALAECRVSPHSSFNAGFTEGQSLRSVSGAGTVRGVHRRCKEQVAKRVSSAGGLAFLVLQRINRTRRSPGATSGQSSHGGG